jgi:hypothetical protein
MAHAEMTLGGGELRSALSLAAQVMNGLDSDGDLALHIDHIGHGEMTDALADVVLAVLASVVGEVGSLREYWSRIEHRGIPLYECADAIGAVVLDLGFEDPAALEASAVRACLALLQPIVSEAAEG